MSDNKKKISLPILSVEDDASSSTPSSSAAAPKSRSEGGDVLTEIAQEVRANTVVLYMKGTPAQPMCGFSARAAGILDSYGLAYHAVNVLADPEKRQGIKTYSDWPTIPQVYLQGELLGGSDILTQMYENGQLDELMKKISG